MTDQRAERRLAAIMATDVVGYSRLMEKDEAGTLAALKAHRAELIDDLIADHHGRVVKLMGDGALVEFPSVVAAVQCAVDIQAGLAARNAELPQSRRLELRIGVNLGDVIIDGDDLYGDGVNVAARLQQLAPPGGVCVSDLVRHSVDGKLAARFEDAGQQEVKNLTRPVHVFRLVPEGDGAGAAAGLATAAGGRPRWAAAAGLAGFLAAGAVVAWAMLGENRGEAPATGCTDHLGLPVAPDKCAEIGE